MPSKSILELDEARRRLQQMTDDHRQLAELIGHLRKIRDNLTAMLTEAIAKLQEVLRPLDIQATLETREIGRDSFTADPSQSNVIWIGGKPIEEWLGARVGGSRCCSVCGGSECRTIEIGEDVYEAVPSEVIVRAALAAASQLVGASARECGGQCEPECCSD